MLAIARALAARPRLLLVDEMSLGLAPVIVDRLARIVAPGGRRPRRRRAAGRTARAGGAVGRRPCCRRSATVTWCWRASPPTSPTARTSSTAPTSAPPPDSPSRCRGQGLEMVTTTLRPSRAPVMDAVARRRPGRSTPRSGSRWGGWRCPHLPVVWGLQDRPIDRQVAHPADVVQVELRAVAGGAGERAASQPAVVAEGDLRAGNHVAGGAGRGGEKWGTSRTGRFGRRKAVDPTWRWTTR